MVKVDGAGLKDWWLVARSGAQLFSFDLESGSWIEGIFPTYQGEIIDLPNTEIFNAAPGLPLGAYTLYFGVDRLDGLVNADNLVFDSLDLTVEPDE